MVKAQKKNKSDVTHALDALSEKISDVATQISHQETSQEPNESTSETKPAKCEKKEIPVLAESENNQVSKIETPAEFKEYDIDQLKDVIFDQKAHYELGDHRIDSLLKPECLSSYNIPNDMSYSPTNNEESCIFNFNQCEENEESFAEEEVEKENLLNSGQKFGTNTVEFGLRVESQRAGYASKYLFNKTSGPAEKIEEDSEEESYENDESYASADYSNTNITEANFSVAVASPDSSVEPINQVSTVM